MSEIKHICNILPEVKEDIETSYFTKFPPSAIKTYYPYLDKITSGFDKCELSTIIGYADSYVDTFLLNIAKNIVIHSGKHVLVLDLSPYEDNKELTFEIKQFKNMHYFIIANDNIEKIEDVIKQFSKKYDKGVVFIKGVNHLVGYNQFVVHKKLEGIARALKKTSKTTKLPIIISANITMLQYKRALNIYNLGLYDALAYMSDKVITVTLEDNGILEKRQDLFIKVIKNKFGQTGMLKYGLYKETLNIIAIESKERKLKVANLF